MILAVEGIPLDGPDAFSRITAATSALADPLELRLTVLRAGRPTPLGPPGP